MSVRATHGLRVAQVASAVFFSVACSGVVFGFAALKPVLVRHGVYAELCHVNNAQIQTCVEQELRLNYIFTLATVISNVSALPIGFVLDGAGPLFACILGAILFALGSLSFGLGRYTPVDTYQLGFTLFATGGPLIYMSSFHLSNAFPRRSGLIMGLLTGAFDVSSVTFVLFYWLDSHRAAGIQIRTFFWYYCIIPALIVVQQAVFGARTRYTPTTHLEDTAPAGLEGILITQEVYVHSDLDPIGHQRTPSDASEDDDESPEQNTDDKFADPLRGVNAGTTFRKQITSRWFLALVIFLCVEAARINWFIQTANSQLRWYLSPPIGNRMSEAFSILLPLGGVASIPLAAHFLDTRGSYQTLVLLLILGTTYGLLGIMPSTLAQAISTVIFVVFRPLMYTFVNDYSAKVFGFETFGSVVGLASLLAGVFGFVLRPLDFVTTGPFHGSYTPVNLIGVIAGATASIFLLRTIRAAQPVAGYVRLD